MKRFIVVAFVLAGAMTANSLQAHAQNSGVLQAPPDITNIVSIDAHNVIVIESQNSQQNRQAQEPKKYTLYAPRHIYSGALARLFGGSVLPTEALIIPESALRNRR